MGHLRYRRYELLYVALLWRHNPYCYCNTVLLPSPPPLSSTLPFPPLPSPPLSSPSPSPSSPPSLSPSSPPSPPLPPPLPSPGRKLDSLAHTHRVELSELKIRWG